MSFKIKTFYLKPEQGEFHDFWQELKIKDDNRYCDDNFDNCDANFDNCVDHYYDDNFGNCDDILE